MKTGQVEIDSVLRRWLFANSIISSGLGLFFIMAEIISKHKSSATIPIAIVALVIGTISTLLYVRTKMSVKIDEEGRFLLTGFEIFGKDRVIELVAFDDVEAITTSSYTAYDLFDKYETFKVYTKIQAISKSGNLIDLSKYEKGFDSVLIKAREIAENLGIKFIEGKSALAVILKWSSGNFEVSFQPDDFFINIFFWVPAVVLGAVCYAVISYVDHISTS
ncbi:MAG: hypothetical protein KKB51_03250 [Candidatus Riflebacteria bacterium]|nr:hypothetical protein [Candidatus Riflebacteria bacterium]